LGFVIGGSAVSVLAVISQNFGSVISRNGWRLLPKISFQKYSFVAKRN